MFTPPPSLRWGFALLALLPLAADWPRFRGPNGTGVSEDKTIPVVWTKRETLWKVALPGLGHSSPIVWGNRLFVQSATEKERLLICLDAVTGKQLWAKGAPGKTARKHPRNSFASSTPATDGERIYTVFWDGSDVSLTAYDFSGAVVWHQDLGSFTSQHGPGFSPIVHEGLVIVNNDQDGSARLLAFEARTGKKAWEVERKSFRACYSTPFLNPQGAGGTELIVASTAGLAGYNPKEGKELWRYEWNFAAQPMPLRTVGSAVAGDGLVFAISGDGAGPRCMIAVKLGGKGDVTSTNLAWELTKGTPYVPTPLIRNGHLYAVTDDGFASCYEGKTGTLVWNQRLEPFTASPVLIDGKVYAPSEKGDVHVFEATPTGYKSLARNRLGEQVYSSPAVSNGKLYVRGAQHLFCIGTPEK